MRSKEEIIKESPRSKGNTPDWDSTASINERLTIEVLIDIRDELTSIKNIFITLHTLIDERH